MKYTMRFPRALNIRDDLNLTDCLTASGKCFLLYAAVSLSHSRTGVTESIITKKKRKMESEAA